jgi:hypothetical protein
VSTRAARSGANHLTALAREPRPAGSEGEERARRYTEQVLDSAGFTSVRESFSYSTFPGRYATPIAGALGAATVVASAWLALSHRSGAAIVLATGLLLLAAFARAMLGDAVLDLPFMRASSVNVVATHPGVEPRVWLVAHLDSKSQPVPSLARVAGVTLLAIGVVLALIAMGLQLASVSSRTLWWVAGALSVLGAVPVMASVVGASSDGALDNASGVAAVLAAAEVLERDAAVGVLLPSAEELGLAGARAWARARASGVALNCDGVDDDGELTIMHGSNAPAEIIDAIRQAAPCAPRVRRMPLGLLTDSVALTDRGWRAVTLSRGSFASLRRVHTPHDSLARLRGSGVDDAATVLARTAEALA